MTAYENTVLSTHFFENYKQFFLVCSTKTYQLLQYSTVPNKMYLSYANNYTVEINNPTTKQQYHNACNSVCRVLSLHDHIILYNISTYQLLICLYLIVLNVRQNTTTRNKNLKLHCTQYNNIKMCIGTRTIFQTDKTKKPTEKNTYHIYIF